MSSRARQRTLFLQHALALAFAGAALQPASLHAACKNSSPAAVTPPAFSSQQLTTDSTGTFALYLSQIQRGASAAVLRDITTRLNSGQLQASGLLDAIRAAAYSADGDEEIARQHAERALGLKPASAADYAQIQAVTATVFLRLGMRSRGLELLNGAYQAYRQQNDNESAALVLANLAQASRDRTESYTAAAALMDQTDTLVRSPRGRAALTIGARVAVDSMDASQRDSVRFALVKLAENAERIGDEPMIGAIAYLRASLVENEGNLAAAGEANKRLLDRAVATRTTISPEWLWQRARILAAAGNVSGAREAYADLTARLSAAKPSLDPALLGAGSSFRERYSEAYLQYADLLLRDAKAANPPMRQALLRQVRDLAEFTKVAEAADYFRDPCIGAAAQTRDVESADRTAVTLYPIVYDDRLELLIGRGSNVDLVSVPVTRLELTKTVNEYRRLLEKRSTAQHLRPSRKLYDWLIRPAEKYLAAAADSTLVVVPDALLRSVPFSALNDGDKYLVEKWPIGTTISISLTDPKRIETRELRPVVKGLTEARLGFTGLPAVADEVSQIGRILNTTPQVDRDFTERSFALDLEKRAPSVVHVASHGQFSADPRESFLLTYDTKMTLDKLRTAIAAGATQNRALELLMLSACQTAVGDERSAMGLAGVALRSGARSALASLWYVNDESTAELSSSFYENLITKGQTRAGALRNAQITMLQAEKFAHPAYWAPFLMVGSWL